MAKRFKSRDYVDEVLLRVLHELLCLFAGDASSSDTDVRMFLEFKDVFNVGRIEIQLEQCELPKDSLHVPKRRNLPPTHVVRDPTQLQRWPVDDDKRRNLTASRLVQKLEQCCTTVEQSVRSFCDNHHPIALRAENVPFTHHRIGKFDRKLIQVRSRHLRLLPESEIDVSLPSQTGAFIDYSQRLHANGFK